MPLPAKSRGRACAFQEREARLQALRDLIDAAEAQGGEDSEEDVGRALYAVEARLREELR